MKNFILFFSVVLVVYGSINYYIFIRGWQAIPKGDQLRTYYLIIFLILALSYFVGRILENYLISSLSDAFIWIGSFYLAIMVYLFLSILLIDIFRLINLAAGIFPQFIYKDYAKTKMITAVVVVSVTLILVITGRINSLNPKVTTLNLHVNKKAGDLKQLNIAMASDIHLGTIIGNSRLDYLHKTIQSLNPDIILFAGDIVDEDLGPVIKQNLGETLKLFEAKYGVYAITGNHEYIGGVQAASRYLSDHGITMLRDTSVKINNGFYLVGREDRSMNSFSHRSRAPLTALMENVDKSLPVIMMDHQPFQLNEAQENGVDLQLSGHTHHGQLWPFNFITKMVYEVSKGYKQKGNSHIYVSSGYGGWGPPIRLGSRSEIVNIKLTFD